MNNTSGHFSKLFYHSSRATHCLVWPDFGRNLNERPKLGVRMMGFPFTSWTFRLGWSHHQAKQPTLKKYSGPTSILLVKNMSWVSRNVHRDQKERGFRSPWPQPWESEQSLPGLSHAALFSASLKFYYVPYRASPVELSSCILTDWTPTMLLVCA